MSTPRRVLTLIGLATAVLIGSSIPASAAFSEAVAVTTTVGTATIAPPTQVAAKSMCTTTVDPATTLVEAGPTDEVHVSTSGIDGADPRISVTTLTGTNSTASSAGVRVQPC